MDIFIILHSFDLCKKGSISLAESDFTCQIFVALTFDPDIKKVHRMAILDIRNSILHRQSVTSSLEKVSRTPK